MFKEYVTQTVDLIEEYGKKLNKDQSRYLAKEHNAYISFTYARMDDITVFKTTEEAFDKMEYYLGLEYERDCQETYIKCGNEVIVSYYNSERVDELVDNLEKLA